MKCAGGLQRALDHIDQCPKSGDVPEVLKDELAELRMANTKGTKADTIKNDKDSLKVAKTDKDKANMLLAGVSPPVASLAAKN